MKILAIFPKDSASIIDPCSTHIFDGATVQLYNIMNEFHKYEDIEAISLFSVATSGISLIPIMDFYNNNYR